MRNVGTRPSWPACALCVVLLCLKGIVVEKRKLVVLIAYTTLGLLTLIVLAVSGHLN